MSYAIEALKCEKERVQNQIEDLKSLVWKTDADLVERNLRIEHLDAAIATLMAA